MAATWGERIIRMEARQEYLIEMIEAHVSKGCDDNNCKLNDRMVSCETNLQTYKRGMWVALSACLALMAKGAIQAWLK